MGALRDLVGTLDDADIGARMRLSDGLQERLEDGVAGGPPGAPEPASTARTRAEEDAGALGVWAATSSLMDRAYVIP